MFVVQCSIVIFHFGEPIFVMKVGFIGLGRMGKGMAHRILGGGHDLAVYDVVREATAEFAAAGARVPSSLAEVWKDREAVQRCNLLFQVIGRRTFEAGVQPEAATAIKLANNLVLGAAIVAQAEAFSLVRKYGVAPQVMYDVMTDGLFAGAPAYKGYGKTMVDESYDNVGSPVQVGIKDANLILAAADLARVPLPTLDIYRDRLLGAIAHGDGDRDQAVLAREQARACGLE